MLKGAVQYLAISLHCKLPPIHTLKWPGRSSMHITCNTLIAYHVQHAMCHLVGRDSSDTKFDRVEIAFIWALLYWLKPLTHEYFNVKKIKDSIELRKQWQWVSLLNNFHVTLNDCHFQHDSIFQQHTKSYLDWLTTVQQNDCKSSVLLKSLGPWIYVKVLKTVTEKLGVVMSVIIPSLKESTS